MKYLEIRRMEKMNFENFPSRCLFLLFFALVTSSPSRTQSLYAMAERQGKARGLTASLSAKKIGDVLTVVISESYEVEQEDKIARTSSNTLAAKLESFKVKANAFKGGILPDLDIRSSKSQSGTAKQEKDQDFQARVACIVKDVLPNGNLVISGRRTIIVDQEEKTLKISGIISRFDIDSDNRVASDKVAEAKVAIVGKGANSQYVTKGPIARIVETAWWLVWPF